MRIDQLAALVEVAKSGSINSASKKLHVTQQSLNKSLKSLENEMNCHLLDRTKKGIRLTADGGKVLSAAQDIISRLNKLERELNLTKNADTSLHGNLNVNLSPMLNISVLPVAFKDFIFSLSGGKLIYCRAIPRSDFGAMLNPSGIRLTVCIAADYRIF